MKHSVIACVTLALCLATQVTSAQSNKEKKSRYYQNSQPEQEFNVQGFATNPERKEVDKKSEEDEYDVKLSKGESDGKYHGEKRVIKDENEEAVEEEMMVREKKVKQRPGYYTTYGTYKPYNEKRPKYDKYYENGRPPVNAEPSEPVVREEVVIEESPRHIEKKVRVRKAKEQEIKMTDNEHEYKTTVVKRRYTNLDVFCDDLDLAKIQRPVFKGICEECAEDVDRIITNKNLSSLEKNYQLKQCYMMRDKRLRETLDEDQYKKFLRIKDADEYLVLTHDSELKDGINN